MPFGESDPILLHQHARLGFEYCLIAVRRRTEPRGNETLGRRVIRRIQKWVIDTATGNVPRQRNASDGCVRWLAHTEIIQLINRGLWWASESFQVWITDYRGNVVLNDEEMRHLGAFPRTTTRDAPFKIIGIIHREDSDSQVTEINPDPPEPQVFEAHHITDSIEFATGLLLEANCYDALEIRAPNGELLLSLAQLSKIHAAEVSTPAQMTVKKL